MSKGFDLSTPQTWSVILAIVSIMLGAVYFNAQTGGTIEHWLNNLFANKSESVTLSLEYSPYPIPEHYEQQLPIKFTLKNEYSNFTSFEIEDICFSVNDPSFKPYCIKNRPQFNILLINAQVSSCLKKGNDCAFSIILPDYSSKSLFLSKDRKITTTLYIKTAPEQINFLQSTLEMK